MAACGIMEIGVERRRDINRAKEQAEYEKAMG
jgi:hypothetical protein